jgi:hypothetical protein
MNNINKERVVTSWRLIICVKLFILLSACASLSKDECLIADWQLIGYEDGLKGSSLNRIGEHREACAKHGITPDLNAYNRGHGEGILNYCNYGLGLRDGQSGNPLLSICPNQSEYHQGYAQGLESYCTYNSGYQQGLSGRAYRNACSGEAEQNFLDGYDGGKHIYNLQSALRSLAIELDGVIEDQEANDENIEETKGRIAYDESLTPEQRRRLLERLEEYSEFTVDLENRHIAIEVEMESIRRELAELGQ